MHGLEIEMAKDDDLDFIAKRIIERKNDYYRVALSFCGKRDDALDAVSEMTLVAIEKIGSLRNRDAFTGWSTQILVNIS